jgi:hypothetical protein
MGDQGLKFLVPCSTNLDLRWTLLVRSWCREKDAEVHEVADLIAVVLVECFSTISLISWIKYLVEFTSPILDDSGHIQGESASPLLCLLLSAQSYEHIHSDNF